MSTNYPKEGWKMCREYMLQQIRDVLETASDTDVESIYWMVMLELGEG